MWTQAARRWAAAGIPVLRLDVEAIGDADGDASRFGEVAELYVPGYVDQVRAALDELERRGAPGRFVLVGLCSGAFWAFHAAQRDDRVPAVVMVNPRLFFWDEWVDAARDWRKLSGALRPRGLAALLRASNPLRRLIAVLLWIVRLPAHMAVRRRARREAMRAGGDDLDRALDRLRDTGTRVTMIFSGEEPLFDELRREGRLERMDRWPNVEIVGAPGRSHTLKPEWVQAAVGALLDRAIERERAAPDPERAYS
jgi:hypothetical protein